MGVVKVLLVRHIFSRPKMMLSCVHSFWILAGLLALTNKSHVYRRLTFPPRIFPIPIRADQLLFYTRHFHRIHTVAMDGINIALIIIVGKVEHEKIWANIGVKLNSIYFVSFLFFSSDRFWPIQWNFIHSEPLSVFVFVCFLEMFLFNKICGKFLEFL